MSRMLAGVLIGMAASAVIYAGAATTATRFAGSFVTMETASHLRNVEFAARAKRVSAEHRVAREKCAQVAEERRRTCNAEASATEGFVRTVR